MDYFQLQQLIAPSCHFFAKWISRPDAVKDLEAVIRLTQKNHSPREIKFVVIVSPQPAQGMNCQVS